MQPQHRLRARADFESTRRHGRTRTTPLLSLTAARNDLSLVRCGTVVSRRVGTAVVRNRVRRRLREILRRYLPQLEDGWDLVLTARPAAATALFLDLARDVDRLLQQARLLDGTPENPPKTTGPDV